jgi:hypothetical protein
LRFYGDYEVGGFVFLQFFVVCRFYEIRQRMTSFCEKCSSTQTRPISRSKHAEKLVGCPARRVTQRRGARAPLHNCFAQVRVFAGEQFLRELIAALVRVAPGAGEIIIDPGSVVLGE